jgi:hypothetical protein
VDYPVPLPYERKFPQSLASAKMGYIEKRPPGFKSRFSKKALKGSHQKEVPAPLYKGIRPPEANPPTSTGCVEVERELHLLYYYYHKALKTGGAGIIPFLI